MDFPRNGGMIAAKRGDGNDQKTTPESQSGFQGEGGPGGDQRREALIELAQDFDVHPNQIKQWRDQLLEGVTGIFGEAGKAEAAPVIDAKSLHAKIRELEHR